MQALYLMKAPAGLEERFAVAEFAWLIRNLVRPMGLKVLGGPCQIMGTGVALPWNILNQVNLASGNIVEDLEMGVKFARAGYAPMLTTAVQVESTFPYTEAGAISQRRRWEQGALSMLMRQGLATFAQGLARLDFNVMGLALDMLVPPLVFHATLLAALLGVTGLFSVITGSSFLLPLAALFLCALFFSAILLSWAYFGRDILPVRVWPKLLSHVLAKLKIYRKSEAGKGNEWVRADRTGKTPD